MSTTPWDLCAKGAFNITPSDASNLTKEVVAISINGGGNIRAVFGDGIERTIGPLPVGRYDVHIVKIFNTDTTATGIVGFYCKR